MSYQDRTYISFHSYNERNKKNLQSFKNEVLSSRDMSLDKVYSLAREHRVPSVGTSRAAIKPRSAQMQILW